MAAGSARSWSARQTRSGVSGRSRMTTPVASRTAAATADATHSNAFTVWQNLGSPTAPTDAQYAQLVAAGQLAALGDPTVVPVANGAAMLKFALPRQAVSLLVLEW